MIDQSQAAEALEKALKTYGEAAEVFEKAKKAVCNTREAYLASVYPNGEADC